MPFTSASTPARAGVAPRPWSFYGLLAVVAISPLPIGAVSQWAWGSLALAVGVLLSVWATEVLRGTNPPKLGPFLPALLCFGVAISWAAAQAWPGLPDKLHNSVWEAARPLLDPPPAATVSVNPQATVNGIVRLGTYAGIIFLALVHCRSAARARAAVVIAAASVTLYALYGLVIFLGGSETVLWFSKTAYIGDLTGPLVNRNSFATYCGLGLLCLGTLMAGARRERAAPEAPWRERMRLLLEFISGRGLVYAGGFTAVALALMLTHSRGGLIAALIGIVVFIVSCTLGKSMPLRRSLALAAVAAVGLAAVLASAGNATLVRFLNTEAEAEARMGAYERTLDAIADAPHGGTGLGTYRDVFQMYRTPSMEKPFFRAHNTYLENALELGIPAAVALTAAVAWLALQCLQGTVRRRRDAVYPCLGFAATALVGTHALVDFSLQIPAVAALYFLLLGIGCAQSRSSRES